MDVRAWSIGVISLALLHTGCGGEEFSQSATGGTAGTSGSGGGGAGAAGSGATGGSAGTGPRLTVFVTANKYDGKLNGPAGADTLCDGAASQAGLSGTFVAWLSTPEVTASSRIASGGPWHLPSGALVAASREVLLSGALDGPINEYADGTPQTDSSQVWTGTLVKGDSAADHCKGWTSREDAERGLGGECNSKGVAWTEAMLLSCATARRLYCFQR